MQVTNKEFIEAIFKEDAPFTHCTSFTHDPSDIPSDQHMIAWGGNWWSKITLQPNSNQYFTISVFNPDDRGRARRRMALYLRTRVIVLDDVKEKLSLEAAQRLPKPSYILETSPNSEHWGYILTTPESDRSRIDNLNDGLIASDLAPSGKDPGQRGVTRYVRLPEGYNLKKSKMINGQPFKCNMLEWHPERTVTMEQLAEPFHIDLDKARRDSRVDGAADIPDHPILQIPEIIKVKSNRGKGRFDIQCPWVEEHTDQADNGSAIFTNEDGSMGFKCHHTSCDGRTDRDLQGYVESLDSSFNQKMSQWLAMRYFSDIVPSVPVDLPKAKEKIWKQPIPLPTSLLPVKKFDHQLLPEELFNFVNDIAERMQCPPDFPAVALLISLATLVGRRCGIHPKKEDDWLVIPNLWGAVVGRPSLMKSPAIQQAMKPLDDLIKKKSKKHASLMGLFEIEKEAFNGRKEMWKKSIRKAGEKGDSTDDLPASPIKPNQPIENRLKTNSGSVECLISLLNDNPDGLLMFRDELTGWLRGLDKSGKEGDRQFYLEAWNGNGSSFDYDTFAHGHLHCEGLCLSVLGSIQPGPLSNLISDAAKGGGGDDGMVQRFQLMVYPDASKVWKNIDRKPNNAIREKISLIFNNLDEMVFDEHLSFDGVAQAIFDSWRLDLETRIRNESETLIESHLAKYRSLVPSIALLLHLAKNALSSSTADKVNSSSIECAIKWCEYLESHSRRIYGMASLSEVDGAKNLIKKIEQGLLPETFTARMVYKHHWSRLSKAEDVNSICSLLVDHGYLMENPIKGIGRPMTEYIINPCINNHHKVTSSKSIKSNNDTFDTGSKVHLNTEVVSFF